MDIIINNNYEGKLIREVLKKDLGYSMNLIKKLKFSPDGIKVNGEWVTVRYVLKKGDVLSLATEDKPDDVSPYIIPVELPIEVLVRGRIPHRREQALQYACSSLPRTQA